MRKTLRYDYVSNIEEDNIHKKLRYEELDFVLTDDGPYRRIPFEFITPDELKLFKKIIVDGDTKSVLVKDTMRQWITFTLR